VDNAAWLFIVHDLNPRAMAVNVMGFKSGQSWFVELTRITMSERPQILVTGAARWRWDGLCATGWNVGGETARALREQAARISACSLKFFWENAGSDGFERGAIVRSGLRFQAEDAAQGSLWEDRVVLDETFYAALRDHPVPLLEAAIRQLRDRSMSLDIYVWLAWRLHSITRPTPVSWVALHGQFGAGFKAVRQFKPRFTEALDAALAAYPEAHVELSEQAITLHPSRPPIARIA